MAASLFPLRVQGSLGLPGQALCAVLAILAAICNLSTVEWLALYHAASISDPDPRPKSIPVIFEAFQVGQRWSLFAPAPDHLNRKFQVLGYMTDGSTIDVMEHLPVSLVHSGADGHSLVFANHRWLKYFSRLEQFSSDEWSAFGQYLCKRVGEHDQPNGVRRIEIVAFMQSAAEVWKTDSSPVARHVHDCARARVVLRTLN